MHVKEGNSESCVVRHLHILTRLVHFFANNFPFSENRVKKLLKTNFIAAIGSQMGRNIEKTNCQVTHGKPTVLYNIF